MTYTDRYDDYLKQVLTDVKSCKEKGARIAFGYTSNLDVVLKWDAGKFNQLLDMYMPADTDVKPEETIDSMADFTRIVSYHVIRGIGKEIDITDIGVCRYLEKNFSYEYALGGTCAQGAAAVSALDLPILVHVTDKCRPVCEFLNYPNLEMVGENGKVTAMDSVSGEEPVRHMILQFDKGDKICINGTEYEIPLSNRLILDYDQIHKYVPVDTCFLEYLEQHADSVCSYNISGFNGIVDKDILKQKITDLGGHYKRIKAKNKNCYIYLESAHYLNPECKKLMFLEAAGYIDILGMNEEELVDLTAELNRPVDKDDLDSVIEGLDFLLEQYNIAGIVLHTKDYSMYYGSELLDVNIEKGLTIGNLMSGTRARTGRYGSYQDCQESLKLTLSKTGEAFFEQLAERKTNHYACLVPSRYMENPKYTIGLGDTFVAGVQFGFLS